MGWHRPDAYWEEMSYPAPSVQVGGSENLLPMGEEHDVRTSVLVNLKQQDIGDVDVGFYTMYRTGDLLGLDHASLDFRITLGVASKRVVCLLAILCLVVDCASAQ